MRTLFLASAFLAMSSLAFACSSDDETESAGTPNGATPENGDDSTSPPATVSATECNERCTAKLTTCGAPADQVTTGCQQQCATGLTEAQLTCAEAKDCGALAAASTIAAICPASGASDAGTGNDSATPAGGLTVTGKLPSGLLATHATTGGTSIFSRVSFSAAATYNPAGARLPNITGTMTRKVTSPALGACNATFSGNLKSDMIDFQVTGTDTGTANDCGSFTDAIARSGIQMTIDDAPYGTGGTVKLTIDIR